MKNEEVEGRILEETSALFFRNGIRTITMDDIAAKLGISKKTIYIYFKNKDELVEAFTRTELTNQKNGLQYIADNAENAVDEMVQTMTHRTKLFKKANPLLFFEMQKYHPGAWNIFKVFRQKVMIMFVENNLKKGIKQDLYRPELNVKILARVRILESEMSFRPESFPASGFKFLEVQQALLDHYLHGIVTLKGYKLIEKYKSKLKKKY